MESNSFIWLNACCCGSLHTHYFPFISKSHNIGFMISARLGANLLIWCTVPRYWQTSSMLLRLAYFWLHLLCQGLVRLPTHQWFGLRTELVIGRTHISPCWALDFPTGASIVHGRNDCRALLESCRTLAHRQSGIPLPQCLQGAKTFSTGNTTELTWCRRAICGNNIYQNGW